MKKIINGIIAAVFAFALAQTAQANFERTNPVTGETESYTWKFVGTDTWNGTGYWQDSSGNNPSAVPAKTGSNQWAPILFDGSGININAGMPVEGWNLRMGVYNGATIQLNNFVKYQGGTTMWMTVDETSQLTIGGFGKGNISDNQVIKLSTAKASGIAWNVNLESTGTANNTFEYYLKGAGSVSYQAVSAAKHKIKMADVTLSGGEKAVRSKTLVSFTSSSKTFTADATIKRLDSNGGDLGHDFVLDTVNSTGSTTLTTSDDTGTCELVQTSTGIVLYWVDGDPADIAYHPSISVNFTEGHSLSTTADVGIKPYAIPGTSWNNMLGDNGTLSNVTRFDSTGQTIAVPGASVTVSGSRGYWYYTNVPYESDLRRGYIDDNDGNASPQFTVEGIPYEAYTPVLYFSNDTNGRPFGHLTVNGTNYKWDSATSKVVVCEGVEADCWGAANGNAWTEGGNYLVLPAQTAGSLTVVGHRFSGEKRMGVAAFQLVEYNPTVYMATISAAGTIGFSSLVWDETLPASLDGAKLVVNVEEDATLNIDSAVSALFVEFNVASGKTLTLSGETITAGAIAVKGLGIVVAGGVSQLAGTLRGNGNLAYPMGEPSGLVSAWTGCLWTRNAQDEMVAVPGDLSIRSLAGMVVPVVSGAAGYYATVAETREEYGKGSLAVSDVPAGVNVRVTRADGTIADVTPENGTATLPGVHIAGVATMYDATFTNTTAFAYKHASSAFIGLDSALNPKYNNDLNDETTGIYLRHHPYVEDARADISGLGDFTIVVVGQMSPTRKCQFVHIGSSINSNTGLLIATSDTDGKVIIAPNSGKTVDTANAVNVSVPNAASARHAYVIVKKDRTFTVWVDGIKRGAFTVADGWTIGGSGHAGVQVGSDFGGAIKNDSSADKFAAVDNSLDETGVINLIRIYDYEISDAQAEAVFAAYPYVSAGGLYTRTVSADANLSSADAWAKDGSATTYALPEGATVDEVFYNPSATVTVEANATLTVNADLTIDTLTIGGSGTLSIVSDGSHSAGVSGAAVVNSPLSITYGALNLAGTPVHLGSSGTLNFDCSGLDISGVYETAHYQLTGLIDRDDTKVTVTLPSAIARTASLNYNSNGYYELIVAPVPNAGNEVYYTGGYWGTTETSFAVTNASGDATIVFPGDTVVIPACYSGTSAYFGATLPVNVSAIRVEKDFTFESGVDDTAILGGTAVTVADGCTLSFATSWHNLTLGAVAFNGPGGVSIPPLLRTASVAGAVSGTASLTVNGSVSVASGGSIANTLSGSGSLTFAALPSSALSFGTWTGTVSLPALSGVELNLNNYGVAGSTVRVAGASSGTWLSNATVEPTVVLDGDMTLNTFSATFANTINTLSGTGAFSLTADGTSEGYQDGYFLVKDVSGFTGSITIAAPGLAIGAAKPSNPTTYGQIVITTNATVGAGATWTAPNGVALASAGATLTVPGGATVPAVTSGVFGCRVATATEGGSTVYSLQGDIAVDGVTVPISWVDANGSDALKSATLEALAAALQTARGANGLTYFESYALGLVPSNPSVKPISDLTASGSNMLFYLGGVGAIPAGVTLTVRVMSATSLSEQFEPLSGRSMTIVGNGSVPTETISVPLDSAESVRFYYLDISISATP